MVLILGLTANLWLAPIAERKLLASMQDGFDSDVQIRNLKITVFPRLHLQAEGIVFRHKQHVDAPPLFTIAKLTGDAGLLEAMATPHRISKVHIEGLVIQTPPKKAKTEPDPPDHKPSKSKTSPFVIGHLDADGTVLKILPRDPRREPQVYNIHRLRMRTIATDQPMEYDAELSIAKPPGNVISKGKFGPWAVDEPADTPLAGHYTLADADLSVFKGIAGKLASKGEFKGILGKIEAHGDTDVPDFMVKAGGHPMRLTTTYDATIDGTDGDTYLHPVVGHFGRSTAICSGSIAGQAGVKGKTVSLEGQMDQGRLEDILHLAVHRKAAISGAIRFHSKIVIPPGDIDVVDKLHLLGSFGVQGGHFSDPQTQEKISNLSDRARGEPDDDSDVLTGFKGGFRLDDGLLHLSGLSFSVPGATIELAGTYRLRDGSIDLHGQARLAAKVSQTTTGWKSFLLKAVDPLFKKKGVGAVVPIHIGGTKDKPSFGLAMTRH